MSFERAPLVLGGRDVVGRVAHVEATARSSSIASERRSRAPIALPDHLGKETICLFKGERSIPDQPVQDTQSTGDRETGSSGEATRPEVIRQHESASSFSDCNARRLTWTNLA